MSNSQVRRARPNECENLTQLCLNSKKSLGYDDAFMAQCVDELTITPDTLEQEDHWVFVEHDMAVGVVALYKTEIAGTGEIKTFFIAPDERGKGIGRTLWNHIMHEAERAGITKLRLTSEPLSTGFYSKLGFDIVGEEPSGSIAGRSLPLMELDLRTRTP